MKKPRLSNSVIDYDVQKIGLVFAEGFKPIELSFEFVERLKVIINRGLHSKDNGLFMMDYEKAEVILFEQIPVSFDEIFYLNNMI